MSGDRRISLITALRITSTTSLLTVLFGIGTNKLIAVFAGPNGVALIGLYRTLGAIVSTALSLGISEVMMQRLSTRHEPGEAKRILEAGTRFFLAQTGMIVLVALVGAPLIANAMFGGALAGEHVSEVRLVVFLTVGVLALQATNAALNGLGRLREVNWTGLITSLLTLATTYPFLLLGRIGLAFIIGFTCFLGAALGCYYISRTEQLRGFRFRPARSWREMREALPFSGSLALLPILSTGTVLIIQSALNRHYGTEHFGLYSAASLLETTSMLVLTSSMRSYFMPSLGRLTTPEARRELSDRMLTVLLFLLMLGLSTLFLSAHQIIQILFSSQFGGTRDLLFVLVLSMPGQVVVWVCVMNLFNRADFRVVGVLELTTAMLRIVGSLVCVRLGMPMVAIAGVHALAYTVSGVMYLTAVGLRHGRLFNVSTIVWAVAVLGLLLGGRVLVSQTDPSGKIAFAALALAGCAGLGHTCYRKLRGADA